MVGSGADQRPSKHAHVPVALLGHSVNTWDAVEPPHPCAQITALGGANASHRLMEEDGGLAKQMVRVRDGSGVWGGSTPIEVHPRAVALLGRAL